MAWAYPLLPWIGLVLLAGVLFTLMCYWPLRLDVSLRARGTADGGWVVAGGLSLPLTSVAFVWGRGLSPRLSFLLLGRKLSWHPRWSQRLAGRFRCFRPCCRRWSSCARRPAGTSKMAGT